MSQNFQDFINNCWTNHAKNPEDVAKELKANLHLIDSEEKVPAYISITVHTLGGHLGKWEEGKEIIQEIEKNGKANSNQSIYRGLATLSFCQGNEADLKHYLDLATEENSDVRIFAMAASELTAQGKINEAMNAFEKALSQVPNKIAKDNPAARSLAICGNNLACELEEKENRTKQEIELMLLAAKTGRKYWEISGTWLEVERAEYRLSMSYLKAQELSKALDHARECQRICLENEAAPFELFFAHEALTKVNKALCEELKNKVKPEYQEYCVMP